MFGYININKEELRVKEYYKYKAFYCGLCEQLKQDYGRLGQITLTYDMTFLIVLLTSLYEERPVQTRGRCLAHPTQVHDKLKNEITSYAADMNIALMYHKFMDDWNDEHKKSAKLATQLFKRKYQRIAKKYPRQCIAIQECLNELSMIEKRGETQLDFAARPFGELMGEIFVYKEDQWQQTLRNMGFYLGKFIYILDAYQDIEKDEKSHSYNPFLASGHRVKKEEIVDILTLMMGECTREFEKLPLLWDVELLRNILYAGVFKKFEKEHEGKDKKI